MMLKSKILTIKQLLLLTYILTYILFTNLIKYASLNAKINQVKNEIPSITNLATTTAFTVSENKIPHVSDLVKNADYDAEMKDIKNKYFTTSDYNKFTNNILDAKITTKKLVKKHCQQKKK